MVGYFASVSAACIGGVGVGEMIQTLAQENLCMEGDSFFVMVRSPKP